VNKGEYKIILTDDGSASLYSGEYDETMHTTDGAFSEAVVKHVLPSRIIEKPGMDISVLDVGMGLGYNALALMQRFCEQNTSASLSIVSLEKDFSFLPLMDTVTFQDASFQSLYTIVKKAAAEGTASFNRITLHVIRGDARNSIVSLKGTTFDAVFQDPYSPSKNPELWSVDYFKSLYHLCSDDCILTTYSSAPHVRRALMEAGFTVGKGPGMGMKREGTTASKSGRIEKLKDDEINAILTNPKSIPYRDEGLNGTRDDLRERRSGEIRELKAKTGRQVR